MSTVASVVSNHLPHRSGPDTKRPRLQTQFSNALWAGLAIASILTFAFRFHWLFPNGVERSQLPGEYYSFRIPRNKAFLWTHLACVMPSALLATTQFVPRIRARAIGFHRNVGRVTNTLTFVSTLAGLGIARVAFGADLAIQSSVYCLGAMTLWSTAKSWIAIRRLQIDEHREWIIRSWSYQMIAITERLIMPFFMIFVNATGGWYHTLSCDEIAYVLRNESLYIQDYPQCQSSWAGSPVTHVSIEATMSNKTTGLTATTRVVFGCCMWLAIWIHLIGTEYYLFITRDESNRLRAVSAKRQNLRQVPKGDQSGVQ